MTTNEVTYAKAWEMLDTGVRLGSLPSFAYVLGSHVIHRMSQRGLRILPIALPDMYGVALRFPRTGRYLAGQLETLVHEGIGTQVGNPKWHISAHYIDALQKLHWSGVLRSTLWASDITAPGWDETHFTMDPKLREGENWNERTRVTYMLPQGSLQAAVERFAEHLDPTLSPATPVVGFLG